MVGYWDGNCFLTLPLWQRGNVPKNVEFLPLFLDVPPSASTAGLRMVAAQGTMVGA